MQNAIYAVLQGIVNDTTFASLINNKTNNNKTNTKHYETDCYKTHRPRR